MYNWLEDVYKGHLLMGHWDYVARTYLLLLVVYTIFADKSFIYVDAKYVLLFWEFAECGNWSRAAALTYLYDQIVGKTRLFTNLIYLKLYCF